ncbi:MAG TPA: uroporphyrinogen-III C-methyltransferase [Bauldia sp.]|nr:uroporphyrinogen-III C-methyltransferase [Bauldia sp.]
MSFENSLAAARAQFPQFRRGHVWLVGAGPGDPGLLTLHAVDAIARADVIVHDALVDPRIIRLADETTRLEAVGKRGGQPSPPQSEISERLIVLARRGERVLRLKGGDPFVFGRGGEEAMALAAAGIPFRIVSGITSGLAGLVAAAIPTTLRGVNQAVILATGSGAEDDSGLDWAALAGTRQPLVLYMAIRNLASIAAALIAGGLAPTTPAAVVVAATMADERVLVSRLDRVAAEAAAGGFGSPAIVCIGSIVAAREVLHRGVAAAAKELQ